MKKELIQAMLDGKTIVNQTGKLEAFFDVENFYVRPSGGVGIIRPLVFEVFNGDWKIKPEPKTRPMTTGEAMVKCINNPNIVVSHTNGTHYHINPIISTVDNISRLRWNQLQDDGTLKHDEWKEFEVTK